MRSFLTIVILLLSLVLAACTSSTCPPGSVSYLTPPFPTEDLEQPPVPQVVEINRMDVKVDEVIRGPVCNDSWKGSLYVTCDIQIPPWEEEALFFQDCELDIAEDTLIFVEAHGNQPYAQGCSCHE